MEVTDEDIQRIKSEKEKKEKERRRGQILEKIAEETQLEIPESLIESEKKRMLEDLKNKFLSSFR